MRPAISTRLFGGLPTLRELLLVQRAAFLDLEVWTDPIAGAASPDDAAAALVDQVRALGLNVPCVHLPTHGVQPAVDIAAAPVLQRRETHELWRRSLDLASALRAACVVAHVGPQASDELLRFAEEAAGRQIALALEVGAAPGATLPAMLSLARRLGGMHGVCVDLSSEHPSAAVLQQLGRRLVWLEVSGVRGGLRHLPPDESDVRLLPLVEAVSMLPFVGYEVAVPGVPGEAEATLMLRRINAWHRQGGLTRYEEAVPELPIG